VLFCAIGVYSTNNNTWDIWMVAMFGVVGYTIIGPRMKPNSKGAGSMPSLMKV